MKALLIGKPFFDYHIKIADELTRLGYSTQFYSDTPKNHLAVRKLFGVQGEQRMIQAYQKKELYKCLTEKYDLILVLVGRYLTASFLKNLKAKNPDSRLVLYLWDDIARVENFKEVRKCYDAIYSFDLNDCEKNEEFVFLPLFYSHEFTQTGTEKSIDIYGSFSEHSGRKRIATEVCLRGLKCGVKCRFILFPGRYKYVTDYLRNKKIEKKTGKRVSFVLKPLNGVQNAELVRKSRALLDVQYPSQNGLTMRSIESIGADVKLITTNANIKRYDFYPYGNCLVMDRDNPAIDLSFIRKPFQPLPKEIKEKYSITSWAEVITGKREQNYLV